MLARARSNRGLLVAVADGMGGHQAGEVASALAISSLDSRVEEADHEDTPPEDLLAQAVEYANRAIWEAAYIDADKEGMGTTLVCALVSQTGDVVLANVGDSNGETQLLTIDHTWVTEQVLSGQMSEREARTSPYRNLLTRSLGGSPRVGVDIFTDLQLQAGDALVLCSDGVTGYLDAGDFSAVLGQAPNAQAAAERLVQLAVRRGGADNATAVVVRRVATA
jgi:protein phosphatase